MSDGITNDPEMEKLGANAAATYALEYWRKLAAAARLDGRQLDPVWGNNESEGDQDELDDASSCSSCLSPSSAGASAPNTSRLVVTHSSKNDAVLYARFKSNFSNANLSNVGDSPSAFNLRTELWRSILVASEGLIPDHSFMSLLRERSIDPFYMNEDSCCPGIVVVPRAQFLFIEVARCREGYYGRNFRKMLAIFELKTFADQMYTLAKDPAHDEIAELCRKLRDQYPLPQKNAMKASGVGRALAHLVRRSGGSSSSAVDLLNFWKHGIKLGDLARPPPANDDSVSEAAAFALKNLMMQQRSRTDRDPSAATDGAKPSVESLDISSKDPKEAARIFSSSGVVYHTEPVFTPSEIAELTSIADRGLEALISEQLSPRKLTLDDDFDFQEVRHRPGARLDNRYKIDASLVTENTRVMDVVRSIFGKSEAGSVKLLYAGVVHAWPKKEGSADPCPQVWHRDGPSLFEDAPHHGTHCLNLFVPLVDVSEANGSTEFVPSTHVDANFASLAPAVIRVAENDERELADSAVKPSVPAGGFLLFDIRTLHRGGANLSPSPRNVMYLTFAWDFWTDKHMFLGPSLLPKTASRVNLSLVNGLYPLLGTDPSEGGRRKRPRRKVEWGEEYGHPHFTDKFELLLLEDLNDPDNVERGLKNVQAVRSLFTTVSFFVSFYAYLLFRLFFLHVSRACSHYYHYYCYFLFLFFSLSFFASQ